MAKSFDELRDKTLKGRSPARMEARTHEMLAELLLSELRKQVGVTQEELARRLGVSQPAVASMEKQEDMKLTTLRNVVAALGGRLRLRVELPGRGEWEVALPHG